MGDITEIDTCTGIHELDGDNTAVSRKVDMMPDAEFLAARDPRIAQTDIEDVMSSQ